MADFDRRAHADTLIADIAAVIGDAGLAFDDEDQCQIGFGEESPVDVMYAAADDVANLVLMTTIGDLADGDRKPMFREALKANLYWRGTEGATIGLGPEGHLTLHVEVPVEPDLEPTILREAIESLVITAEAWRRYLDDHQPEASEIEFDEP